MIVCFQGSYDKRLLEFVRKVSGGNSSGHDNKDCNDMNFPHLHNRQGYFFKILKFNYSFHVQ